VPSSEATAVYTEYHVRHLPYAHEVDHLISLELGGSNAIRNLWPEPYAGVWGARTKDKLENRLHALVCAGSLTLQAAQRAISVDWVAAYQRYVAGTPAPAVTAAPPSATTSSPSGPVDPGGFYASSYGSASTIYCADDSGWKRLSTSYLRHFSSWAAAIAAFPSYHQHQPC
jgi:hypothetical protein